MIEKLMMEKSPSPLSFEFSEWVDRLPESEIRRLLKYNPKYYFAGGKPGILPINSFHLILEEIIEEEKELLKKNNAGVLANYNYGATQGNIRLREVLAKRLQRREKVDCSPDDILITTGSQQTLYALNDVLIIPGDIVLTTRPTYLGFLLPAEKLGAKIVTLPSDKGGLIPEYIEVAINLCQKKFNRRPKMLYIIPYSDNPKGTTLSNERKDKIIDSTYQYNDLLVVEDAAYKEIQFGKGKYSINPLKAKDPENNRIAYLSTSTKEAASFRMGYSVLPKKLRNAMVKAKGYYDLCSSEFIQAILAKYYESFIDQQLPIIRKEYEIRSRTMIYAIENFMPEGGDYTRPTGGFFIWYETPDINFDSKGFIQTAIDHGVAYVPGIAFYPQNGFEVTEDSQLIRNENPTNAMRLCYSFLSTDTITQGIKLLGKLLSIN